MTDSELLVDYGWRPFFQQQLVLEELEQLAPARVAALHRTHVNLIGAGGEQRVPLGGRWFTGNVEERPTVGDWVLIDPSGTQVTRLLDRFSLFQRVSPGTRIDLQPLAANVDTVFIVSSMNDEFNPSRLERYLAVAFEAAVEPVIVLTKADLTDEAETFRAEALGLRPGLNVEAVNALEPGTLDGIRAWCRRGRTVALLGSSGVGKSTLVNALAGRDVQTTGGIREQDAKGRHTTSHRSLHLLDAGGVLLDSPGMRELKLTDVEEGIGRMFADVEELAKSCRFNDCEHASEPGCAVRVAIEAGMLPERRLASYRKLQSEQRYHSETVAEQRHRARKFARDVRARLSMSDKKR